MINFQWDRSSPFIIDVSVTSDRVDGYGHVSNFHFVQWMTDCAFAHSAAKGLPEESCMAMARGMAVRDIKVELLGSAYDGDKLQVANWISKSDGKLRATRQFQIVNIENGRTLVRAEVDFICTNLKTGRPVKMPPIFAEKYIVEST